MAVTTVSIRLSVTASAMALLPASTSTGRPDNASLRWGSAVSSAITALCGKKRRACSARSLQLRPAVSNVARKRCGYSDMMSRAWVPMLPVLPRIAMFFTLESKRLKCFIGEGAFMCRLP